MMRQILVVSACSFVTATPTAAVQFDPPNPEAFARGEDRQRARDLEKPCARMDEGNGCYRYDGRLVRAAPCRYRIDGETASLPTDKCYRMDAPRRFRGIWIDQFEGQRFIPEGTDPPKWPVGDPKSPGWRAQADRAVVGSIWLNTEKTGLGHGWRQGGRRVFIDFIGRKTRYPGNYGHAGLSGNEIVVDRVISHRECPRRGVC